VGTARTGRHGQVFGLLTFLVVTKYGGTVRGMMGWDGKGTGKGWEGERGFGRGGKVHGGELLM
jgi:hypothetical protein